MAHGRALNWAKRNGLLLAGGVAIFGIVIRLRGGASEPEPQPSAQLRAHDEVRVSPRDPEIPLSRAISQPRAPVAPHPELGAETTLDAPAPELLAAALREEDPLPREHVAHELRFRRDDESFNVLTRLLGDEDPAVRGVAAESIAARADRRGISPLIGALEIEDDEDARGRQRAALAALAPDHDYFPD